MQSLDVQRRSRIIAPFRIEIVTFLWDEKFSSTATRASANRNA
jgi:hypothetical protein